MRKAIAVRKETFYRENVCNQSSNPRRWWNLINKLSGGSTNTTTLCYEDEDGNVISGLNLATRLNKFYISVASDILRLDNASLPAFYRHNRNYQPLVHLKYVENCPNGILVRPLDLMVSLTASGKNLHQNLQVL